MDRCVELLDHIADHPTADMVLRARYLARNDRPTSVPTDPRQFVAELQMETMGMAPMRPMPAHVREIMDWADVELQKIRRTKT